MANLIIKVERFFSWIAQFVLIFIAMVTLCHADVSQNGSDKKNLQQTHTLIVNDITQLNPIAVGAIYTPHSERDVIHIIKNTQGPISIGGGRFSQGGQTAYPGGTHIDTRLMNKIIQLDPVNKKITVQAGIAWRDIQQAIDPYNLSIRIMQSYSNFTVGGSLSVNVHGRYVGEGALIKSVESLRLVLADGAVVVASRDENSDLFYGAIGGYGGLGVIVEATLRLTDNQAIERHTKELPISAYKDYFFKNIRKNKKVIFHNVNIYPPAFDKLRDVSWYLSNKPVTIKERLIPSDGHYFWTPKMINFVAGNDFDKKTREKMIDPVFYKKDMVVWRNWEASRDLRELESKDRKSQVYALREYFIPVEKFDQFMPLLRDIFQKNKVNVINVSVRHAFADKESILSWSPQEVFAFVVYYRQGTDAHAKKAVAKWSREMIDAAISVGGTYYLPYQILATNKQFKKAYPRAEEYFALKRKVDPNNRFINMLWAAYYPLNQLKR